MSCSSKITQGDTGPIWHITVPAVDVDGLLTGADADLTNYTCSLTVSDQSDTITTKNSGDTAFLVQLSSTITDALDEGGFNVGIEVRDDTVDPPYVSEIHKRVQISAQLVE